MRRTLVASRRFSWRGCIRCDRCGDTCSARGAALQLCNGRAATLSIGGLPVRVAREEGYVHILQCRDCAAAPHGKGIATQTQLGADGATRAALLANHGALVQTLRRVVCACIHVPHERGSAVLVTGTDEQLWRVREAVRVARDGGRLDDVHRCLEDTATQALGCSADGRPRSLPRLWPLPSAARSSRAALHVQRHWRGYDARRRLQARRLAVARAAACGRIQCSWRLRRRELASGRVLRELHALSSMTQWCQTPACSDLFWTRIGQQWALSLQDRADIGIMKGGHHRADGKLAAVPRAVPRGARQGIWVQSRSSSATAHSETQTEVAFCLLPVLHVAGEREVARRAVMVHEAAVSATFVNLEILQTAFRVAVELTCTARVFSSTGRFDDQWICLGIHGDVDLGHRALDLLAEMSRLVPTPIIRDAFEEASEAEADPRTWSARHGQVRILHDQRVRLLATAAATAARESLEAVRSPCASRLQRWWRRTWRLRSVQVVLDTRAASHEDRLRHGLEEPGCAEHGLCSIMRTTAGRAIQPTWVCFACSLGQSEATMAAFSWLHPVGLGYDLVLGACTLCGGLASGMYFTDEPLDCRRAMDSCDEPSSAAGGALDAAAVPVPDSDEDEFLPPVGRNVTLAPRRQPARPGDAGLHQWQMV